MAAIVAVAREGRSVVGVGAIKRKRPQYAASVSRHSGFVVGGDWHEFGYVAVSASHQGQGLSRRLTTKLISAFSDQRLFATTSNTRMKRTLANAGFAPRGNEWLGTSGQLLSLWVREPTP